MWRSREAGARGQRFPGARGREASRPLFRLRYVMFAADYPFESAQEAGQFLDEVPLAQGVREDVAFRNAVSRLGLPTP